MSAFTGPLTVTQVDANWRMWVLAQQLTYEVGFKGSGRAICVPQGFPTDGATVPRALWALLPYWGTYSRAAVVHDYLLIRLRTGDPHPEAPTRRQADRIFLEAMEVCGTGRIVRTLMYWAVRARSIYVEVCR